VRRVKASPMVTLRRKRSPKRVRRARKSKVLVCK
jgi:hypothetical protein